MKRALALVAVTAAALFAAAPLASADTAPAAPAAAVSQLPAGLSGAAFGDTSWGGACETPNCQPWY